MSFFRPKPQSRPWKFEILADLGEANVGETVFESEGSRWLGPDFFVQILPRKLDHLNFGLIPIHGIDLQKGDVSPVG
jgi:hypothetical protein